MTTETTGFEVWGGGDVRSKNIGPAAGDHLLGRVGAPGLYNFLGENASGKSHHLRMIELLQQDRVFRSDADITHGEMHAVFEIALAKIAFRSLPTGEIVEPERTGLDTLPPIETMPAPIDLIISANNLGLDNQEGRARVRLQNLLLYSPIPSTEEMVRRLARVLEGRAFEIDPGTDRRKLWTTLTEKAKGENKRVKIEPFRSTEEILVFLLARDREGVLDDHGALIDLLNSQGNSGEKAAAQQRFIVAEAAGRLKETLDSVARRLGMKVDAALVSSLRDRAGKPAPDGEVLQQARVEVATKRTELRGRAQEEQRRDALRANHGTKPDTAPAEELLAKARLAKTAADERVRMAGEALAAARRALNDTHDRTASLTSRVMEGYNLWNDSLGAIDTCFGLDQPGGNEIEDVFKVPDVELLREKVAAERQRLEVLVEMVAGGQADVAAVAAREAEVTRLAEQLQQAEAAAAEAAELALAREAEVDDVVERARKWGETEGLLAAPIPGATQEDVAAAEQRVRDLEADDELYRAAQDYQRAAAAHDQEEEIFRWFEGVAADYRKAAGESWSHLGAIVTESLSLPWLTVEGMRIKLHYSKTTMRLRQSFDEPAEVRDLDDQDAISEAELHEACLKLMLQKREKLGGILVVPGRVLHPLDFRRRRIFSGWAAKAGLVVFSERPRWESDPENLVLEYMEPLYEEAVS